MNNDKPPDKLLAQLRRMFPDASTLDPADLLTLLVRASERNRKLEEEFTSFKSQQLAESQERVGKLEALRRELHQLRSAHLADIKRRDALLHVLRRLHNAAQLVPSYPLPEQVREALSPALSEANEVIALTAHLKMGE